VALQTARTPVDLDLDERERQGLRDFWTVYERHYEEVGEILLEELLSVPSIRPLIEATPAEAREEQNRVTRELSRRAVMDGDWEPYLENIRGRGVLYASGDLAFSAWFHILQAFRPLVYPHLLVEYSDDPERLLGALLGMDRFIDTAMSVIGEEYLAAKQRIISEQEEMVQQLSTSRTVLASIADSVITTDGEGRITSINPATERLFGWPADEVIGYPYVEAFPLLDKTGRPIPESERFLTLAIGSRHVVTSRGFDTAILARDGRQVPVAVTASPILDDEGEPVGGVMVLRDVTPEHSADRLKSSLISTVSHELRTPLTMIQGFSELIATRRLREEQVVTAAGQINSSAARLGRLIDDLLSVSRIDAGRVEVRPERLELPDAVAEAVATSAPERTVTTDVDRAPAILADPDLLARILTNLISNAVKYSPDDTTISVTATPAGDHVEVSVEDRGIGISDEEASQLFTKFFRADRREVRDKRGTGLGLYITKNLVEMQGGRIAVRSRPGEGTTVSFALPAFPTDGEVAERRG
jgi:PAS domain S-box-containing protein